MFPTIYSTESVFSKGFATYIFNRSAHSCRIFTVNRNQLIKLMQTVDSSIDILTIDNINSDE